MKKFSEEIDKPVFWITALIALTVVVWGVINPVHAGQTFDNMVEFLSTNFGWSYILIVSSFVIFCIFIAFSKYGSIKLGDPDSEPEYKTLPWIGMLFSSGMAISLIFWCIGEPLTHFLKPPMGQDLSTAEAAGQSMRLVFYHWGLHPWSIFAVTGMALGYCQFNRNLPALFSSTLVPLIGRKGAEGPIGKTVDIIASFATLFGVAVSLGLAALQLNTGLHRVFGIPNNITAGISIIAVITLLYTFTAIRGIDKGIKIVSNLNMVLVVILLLFVFSFGPTIFALDVFTNTLGSYAQKVLDMSFFTDPYNQTNSGWLSSWTLFYWSWWIAWAPPVGGFVARISKGRTLREFVLGVLVAPSLLSYFWMSVFGGTAINMQMNGADIGSVVLNDVTTALFVFLEQLPFSMIMSVLALTLISTFFITSANSATFVMGMFTSGGKLNPSNILKGIWGVIAGSVAAVMLMAGGVNALQNVPILSTLPFMFFIVLMMYSIIQFFKDDFNEPCMIVENEQKVQRVTELKDTEENVV